VIGLSFRIQCDCEWNGMSASTHRLRRIDPDRKEALSNAFHHSHASQIEAEVHYETNQLRLRIRDNGAGIDAKILETGHRSGHWGLPGMRERAEKIGTQVETWSQSGAGTEVELRIPARFAYASQNNYGLSWWFRKVWKRGKSVSNRAPRPG
jgi:nitrate/nitrite-specific signal transduction histidine kinase